MRLLIGCGFLAAALGGTTQAQTIYPINHAEILAGAKFDLKVEVPGAPDGPAIRVAINGQDAAAMLGKSATVIQREDGGDHSAYWIRDAAITKPGRYKVEASVGDNQASVTWEVFDTNGGRKAKNVILFIGDGMTQTHRTAARVMSKGIVEGRYGGDLAMEDMPHMAVVSTSGTDAIVTDSANSAAAYTTGHKSCNNALGIYCARNRSFFDHPRVETITDIVKRTRGMSVGIVTNTEIEDATPASMVSHTRNRRTYNEIVKMMFDAKPDVILGGGSVNFWPKSREGSKREDEEDYIQQFKDAGYSFVTTNTELKAAAQAPKLLGLFNPGNIDGALDRFVLKKGSVSRFPDQPDLTDQLKVALGILSKNDNGFFLMVESGRIDKYSHSLDWERAVYDTIMLDNAVQIGKDFATARSDTLVLVVSDHAHGTAIIGTYDDERPGTQLRDKLGTYTASKFPNYGPPNADGYPERVDVSRRLAFVFSGYPDYCETGRPYMEGENRPAVPNPEDSKVNIANEKYCVPGAARRAGNLPFTSLSGVHAADEVVLTAMGPGAEMVRGRMENTRVFRVMVSALGLGGRD
jgi:alkaline phosphatase